MSAAWPGSAGIAVLMLKGCPDLALRDRPQGSHGSPLPGAAYRGRRTGRPPFHLARRVEGRMGPPSLLTDPTKRIIQ